VWFDTSNPRYVDSLTADVRDKVKLEVERWEASRSNAEAIKEINENLVDISKRVNGAIAERQFRVGVLKRVLQATQREVMALTRDEYEQNLSLEENFIVRAIPMFREASRIYAVSVDRFSKFWVSEEQWQNAREYIANQPWGAPRNSVHPLC
jgi:hypothetical protein